MKTLFYSWLTAAFLLLSAQASAEHVLPDGMGGYYTNDGHVMSDGMGGFYHPDGSHQMSDGMGGYYRDDHR